MHDVLPSPRWRTREQLGPQLHATPLRPLLLAEGSLTRRLRHCCSSAFNLRVLEQRWQRPWPDEQRLLRLSQGRYTLVREIHMACGNQSWLYARTLLPPQALRGASRRFIRAGQRPLGALLFGAPSRTPIVRLSREFARLPAGCRLTQRLQQLLPAAAADLWARRTLYQSRSLRFAIVEVFLPPLEGTVTTDRHP